MLLHLIAFFAINHLFAHGLPVDRIHEELAELREEVKLLKSSLLQDIHSIQKQLGEKMANGVYFMASKTSSEEIDIAPLGTVVYDSVSINEGGYYNSDSGIFTCTVPGWYFFHFAAHASQASTWIPELVKKDASGSVSRSAGGFLNDAHTYTSSNGAVLKCAGGDTVMVRNGSDNTGRIRGTDESVGAQQSVFAGFLLEQEF